MEPSETCTDLTTERLDALLTEAARKAPPRVRRWVEALLAGDRAERAGKARAAPPRREP